jgi:hypothetical protein
VLLFWGVGVHGLIITQLLLQITVLNKRGKEPGHGARPKWRTSAGRYQLSVAK